MMRSSQVILQEDYALQAQIRELRARKVELSKELDEALEAEAEKPSSEGIVVELGVATEEVTNG